MGAKIFEKIPLWQNLGRCVADFSLLLISVRLTGNVKKKKKVPTYHRRALKYSQSKTFRNNF